MNNNICPFCKSILSLDDKVSKLDSHKQYLCRSDNHFFIKRITNKDKLSKLKLRVNDGEERFYLKIDYDNNFTQFWKNANNIDRISVPGIVNIDFSDTNIEKIRNKIQKYLILS